MAIKGLQPLRHRMTQLVSTKHLLPNEESQDRLMIFYHQILASKNHQERWHKVLAHPLVQEFITSSHQILPHLSDLSQESLYCIYCLVILQQLDRIFFSNRPNKNTMKQVHKIASDLVLVENFYWEIGGIIGMHCLALESLKVQSNNQVSKAAYLRPRGIDISKDEIEVRKAVLWGIRHLGSMAEMYPVGGAADRLSLTDDRTGMALPAAKLIFKGKTLLHGMMEDLQAREYLHYKFYQKQIITPVAMMTSREKNNHEQILAICEEQSWFNRPFSSYRFFCQPSIPTLDKKGEWCLQGPQELLMKPGGHGVIWKLARDQGVLDWLYQAGRKKALIRQINNPIASTDHALLALIGLGCEKDKWFGFASCPRQVKATEGINVLIEKQHQGHFQYTLTNIEYCDFAKFEIQDEPEHAGSPYSKFSSNTNILFADLKAVQSALLQMPIPGMLVNYKKGTLYKNNGKYVQEEFGRLESTMQNIADCFQEISPKPLDVEQQENLRTFLTFNKRSKTISTTKREMTLGSSLLETPEGCFLDLLANAQDLLVNYCNWEMPSLNPVLDAFVHGPSFICFYHSALGPLYEIIRQKIRHGKLSLGSELQLEIADLHMENVELDGSLIIHADHLMGRPNEQNVLEYSNNTGKCTLKNVKINNKGIDREAPNVYWKNEITRKESCHITIKGCGELFAQDIEIYGNIQIYVPDRTLVVLEQRGGQIIQKKFPLAAPSWAWKYVVTDDFRIQLKKEASLNP